MKYSNDNLKSKSLHKPVINVLQVGMDAPLPDGIQSWSQVTTQRDTETETETGTDTETQRHRKLEPGDRA